MTKARAFSFGQLSGLTAISISAFACSGTEFTRHAPSAEGGETNETVVVPKHSGTPTHGSADRPSTVTPGGSPGESEGGAGALPQVSPGGTNPGDASAGSGNAANSGGSNTGGANAAGRGGEAGEQNTPDPPVDSNCVNPLQETWTTALGASGSDWELVFGDPSVDVAHHRLVVTYDDVASHKTAYEGGYYVSAEVTLEGGTVLTPYPYANERRWPSLRRSSDGGGVDLGATQYGTSNSWSSNDWPGFSGVTVAGTKTVLLTTYVKATSRALAVKVTYDGHTYRSGWVSGFTWEQTNLGILRYIGENNSRVYTGDPVYVGPLHGCQELSDESVQASFDD